MKKKFLVLLIFIMVLLAENLTDKQRKISLELVKTKLKLIEEDEELFQLHHKILNLHKLLAERLAKKKEILFLNKKLKKLSK